MRKPTKGEMLEWLTEQLSELWMPVNLSKKRQPTEYHLEKREIIRNIYAIIEKHFDKRKK